MWYTFVAWEYVLWGRRASITKVHRLSDAGCVSQPLRTFTVAMISLHSNMPTRDLLTTSIRVKYGCWERENTSARSGVQQFEMRSWLRDRNSVESELSWVAHACLGTIPPSTIKPCEHVVITSFRFRSVQLLQSYVDFTDQWLILPASILLQFTTMRNPCALASNIFDKPS